MSVALLPAKEARAHRNGLTVVEAEAHHLKANSREFDRPDSPLKQELDAEYPDGWVLQHQGTIIGYGSRCRLRQYGKGDRCPSGLTGHHVVPDRCFREGSRDAKRAQRLLSEYKGLVICVDGQNTDPSKQHGKLHKDLDFDLSKLADSKGLATLGRVEDEAAKCVADKTGCSQDDIKTQLEQHHAKNGMGPDSVVRASYDGNNISIADLKKKATEITGNAGSMK